MVWDLRPFLRRTSPSFCLDFTTMPDEITVRTAKEYLYSRLRRAVPGRGRSGVRAVPMKLSGAVHEFQNLKRVLAALRSAGAPRLSDVTQKHLEAVRRGWDSAEAAAVYIALLRHLADHSLFLSQDRLTVYPWPGRTAQQVAGRVRSDENRTERIPEPIMGPLLAAAVFYVQAASTDIRAALREVTALEEARARSALKPGAARARLETFIRHRRAVASPPSRLTSMPTGQTLPCTTASSSMPTTAPSPSWPGSMKGPAGVTNDC
jgi:hypothetical protein